jgi:hypothetical protein
VEQALQTMERCASSDQDMWSIELDHLYQSLSSSRNYFVLIISIRSTFIGIVTLLDESVLNVFVNLVSSFENLSKWNVPNLKSHNSYTTLTQTNNTIYICIQLSNVLSITGRLDQESWTILSNILKWFATSISILSKSFSLQSLIHSSLNILTIASSSFKESNKIIYFWMDWTERCR